MHSTCTLDSTSTPIYKSLTSAWGTPAMPLLHPLHSPDLDQSISIPSTSRPFLSLTSHVFPPGKLRSYSFLLITFFLLNSSVLFHVFYFVFLNSSSLHQDYLPPPNCPPHFFLPITFPFLSDFPFPSSFSIFYFPFLLFLRFSFPFPISISPFYFPFLPFLSLPISLVLFPFPLSLQLPVPFPLNFTSPPPYPFQFPFLFPPLFLPFLIPLPTPPPHLSFPCPSYFHE
jgi:hypothetical protein